VVYESKRSQKEIESFKPEHQLDQFQWLFRFVGKFLFALNGIFGPRGRGEIMDDDGFIPVS
jgi:hypothetical protein